MDPNAPLLPSHLRAMLQKELNPAERITDLLSGRDDRADMQILLLYNILVALAGQDPLTPEPGQTLPASMGVQVPIGIRSVDVMRGIEALTTAEINPQKMADCRRALRMVILVNNSFDQQISVSVIGNNSNTHAGAFEISTITIAKGERGAYGIKNEEWMPFLGVNVTPAVNPTQGSVSAFAILQEQSST